MDGLLLIIIKDKYNSCHIVFNEPSLILLYQTGKDRFSFLIRNYFLIKLKRIFCVDFILPFAVISIGYGSSAKSMINP